MAVLGVILVVNQEISQNTAIFTKENHIFSESLLIGGYISAS